MGGEECDVDTDPQLLSPERKSKEPQGMMGRMQNRLQAHRPTASPLAPIEVSCVYDKICETNARLDADKRVDAYVVSRMR